jgi:hypothetical protein
MLRPSFQHSARPAFSDRGQSETDELRHRGPWEFTAHRRAQLVEHANFPGLPWQGRFAVTETLRRRSTSASLPRAQTIE